MKTEQQLNADILEITLVIQSEYPELSKYSGEMPITIPNESHHIINLKSLQDYYESLSCLLEDYRLNHVKTRATEALPPA